MWREPECEENKNHEREKTCEEIMREKTMWVKMWGKIQCEKNGRESYMWGKPINEREILMREKTIQWERTLRGIIQERVLWEKNKHVKRNNERE